MWFLRGNRKDKRPPNTAFHQQRIRAWRPILTPIPVIILYLLIGIVFVAISIALFVAWSNTQYSGTFRYDRVCSRFLNDSAAQHLNRSDPVRIIDYVNTTSLNNICVLPITSHHKLHKPVYYYYYIENHFQNYQLYVRSRSDFQLEGSDYKKSDLTNCEPIIRDKALHSHHQDSAFLPCGLKAADTFNDSFKLYSVNPIPINATLNGTVNATLVPENDEHLVPLDEGEALVWHEELHYKFKQPHPDVKGVRIIKNFKDPHFIIHMRVATFSQYLKLYAKIHQDIDEGEYLVYIEDRWPVHRFNGAKSIYLSTTTWIGGPNLGLAIAFIVVGGLSWLLALLFILKVTTTKSKLGDHSKLHWFQKPDWPFFWRSSDKYGKRVKN